MRTAYATHVPCPPNPRSAEDPNWTSFANFLRNNGINELQNEALRAYQMNVVGRYLPANQINHCLTLLNLGINSEYAEMAEERYGSDLADYDYQASLEEIDRLFETNAYRFSPPATVYKGISYEPFYEILKLRLVEPGQTLTFHGYLSTSVCREKAQSFCRGSGGILLEISSIHVVDAIVPCNVRVLHAPSSTIPEQEILLDRGCHFQVTERLTDASGGLIVRLEAIRARE